MTIKILRRSGLKSIKLSVRADGRVLVSAPKWVPKKAINLFVALKREWIDEAIGKVAMDVDRFVLRGSSIDYKTHKETARLLVQEQLTIFAPILGVAFNRLSIRNTAGRWGSCSGKKNLNFHYKIAFLPADLVDYLIVHELCHLIEMNHSDKFWKKVSSIIPDADDCAKRLRKWKGNKPWFVYLLRCGDDSLYTGITTNIDHRIADHNAKKGAKYTRSHLPVKLVWSELLESESIARQREAEIKSWTKIKKESLIL